MITLIGTGHVFDLSLALLAIFDEKQPEVICVELDKQRYNALMMRRAHPESYKTAQKNVPVVYKLLARFQESIASEYGVQPGDEMITAITYAQSHQIPLEFIDMNAQQLFTKMWHAMTVSEKLKLLLTGFGAFFVSRKRVEKELQRYQDDFDTYIEEVGAKFPTIKKMLIDERNRYMTHRLVHLNEKYSRVIACVGDGHIQGMAHLLQSKQIDVETIRLQELQEQKTKDVDATSAYFTTDYKSL